LLAPGRAWGIEKKGQPRLQVSGKKDTSREGKGRGKRERFFNERPVWGDN